MMDNLVPASWKQSAGMGILFLLITLAGCAGGPAKKKKKIILADLPHYSLTRTDWDTSACCLVCPMLGQEKHVGVKNLVKQLKLTLRHEGYRIQEEETYMKVENQQAVDKIIAPLLYSPRSRKVEGKTVHDIMAVLSVENGSGQSVDASSPPKRRFFQVWARNTGSRPYRQIAENLLKIDAFRQALQE